ncbi:unnamed protein product [Rotaria sordida]|uniref:TRAF1-6 MATH domain-containing protein n=1 Tax=Rotaria sordida TaxID=392033 RepID=A0A818TFR0_9BILA|nr:unnamed protein product [Rotaria sordida]
MHDERKIIDLPSKVATALSTTLVTDEYNAQQEYINETVNTLSDGIETLNDDIQRLSSESLQQSQLIEMTSQSLTQLKTSCEESNFPFTHKVTFCLFDQTGEQQHIIDSFRPDPKSSSFQKPRCDMNIASGIPKFVSLDKIQQQNNRYIKENTMFIKVMVDFENLPKTMIPFAVGLNPGLPTYCQQRMIQQEIERRVQLQSQKKLTSNAVTTNSNLSISNQ